MIRRFLRQVAVRSCAAALGLTIASLCAAQPYARKSDSQLLVGNDAVELRYALREGRLFLTQVVDTAGGSVEVEDLGFSLELGEAQIKALGPADFAIRETVVQGARAETLLNHAGTGVELRIEWQADTEKGYVRRTLAVRCPRMPPPLLLVARVERLKTRSVCELGGRGQPVFVGERAFLGLEYPAAFNNASDGAIDLHHFPGKHLGAQWLELKPEVIGVQGRHRTLEAAFASYLADVRIPPRTFVHYNGWYDFRRDTMSTKGFMATFEALRAKLVEQYGIPMHAFVIDDQYQNKQSIWKTDLDVLPEDFGPLARHLRAHNSSLGLWMPLTPNGHNLDLTWGRKNGYEVTDTGGNYCVSAPKFNAALRAIVRHHIRTFGVNYYKHDFNNFRCRAAGHGHLPTPEHGFEANVDAYIGVMQYARSLNPDIFLNVTGGMWLSPWWLMVADTVWRGGGDTGREGVVPYIERRDDTMTYVDGVLWDRFVKERRQFPPSALMTHGIIYARRCMLGGKDEPLHRWADHVVMYNAPGLMMKELYLTPALVRDDQWAVLGPTLAWAEAEADLLANCRMTHGNPHRGEVYGYLHVKGERLIWFLRNPGMAPQSVTLPLAGELGGAAAWSVLYPYREDHGPDTRAERVLASYQTLVVSARKDASASPLALFGDCRYAVRSVDGAEVTLDVFGEGGEITAEVRADGGASSVMCAGRTMAAQAGVVTMPLRFDDAGRAVVRDLSPDASGRENRIRAEVSANIAEAKLAVFCRERLGATPMGAFALDGKTVKPRILRGVGWRMFLVNVPTGTHEIAWTVPVTARATRPFAPASCHMGAWLFGRRALSARTVSVRLAKPMADWKRPPTPFAGVVPFRLPVQPVREVSLLLPGANAAPTAADLARASAAKLRVLVFDVNGEEEYENKPVLLNGESIGVLPASSRSEFSTWQEKIMDLPSAALARIRLSGNELVFTNPVGDCYKVSGVGLAVQLADGSWVETNRSATVHCTHAPGSWKYAEGTSFTNDRSVPVRLGFPTE